MFLYKANGIKGGGSNTAYDYMNNGYLRFVDFCLFVLEQKVQLWHMFTSIPPFQFGIFIHGFKKKYYIYIYNIIYQLKINLFLQSFMCSNKNQSSYLNDSNDVSETALQEMSVNKHSESEAGTAVAIYQLSYEPGSWRKNMGAITRKAQGAEMQMLQIDPKHHRNGRVYPPKAVHRLNSSRE